MRLICPNCDAQYEVAEDAIPDEGRDVQCSSCGHAWYQLSPAALAAEAAEAELFDAPDPEAPRAEAVWSPEPDAEPAADPTPEPVEPPAATVPLPAPPPVSRAMDEDMLALLREEAEREVQARAQEGNRIETQGDLGLEAAAISPAARRIAQLKGVDPDAPAPLAAPPLTRPSKGRDLLPNIEEINSTLRPDSPTTGPAAEAEPALMRSGRGFRLGFGLMLICALGLILLYASAPQLAQSVPVLSGVLEAYVTLVDGLRIWLDQIMQRATAGLQG